VTSFFGIKLFNFCVFSKTTRRIYANFFQDLGENTCSLQPALKSTAPFNGGLKRNCTRSAVSTSEKIVK